MSTKSWLLDGEPVTEAELMELAHKEYDVKFDTTESAALVMNLDGVYTVSPIPENEIPAECPWPERLPKETK